MDGFDPRRAAAVREQLIAHVAEKPRPRRIPLTLGLLLAGAVAGAGVSAGAFAATGGIVIAQPTGQPTPSYAAAVEAPPGVLPGAPIISLLGHPDTREFTGALQIDLGSRPAAATHARVTLTPSAAGTVGFGTDPGGNNPSAGWEAADLADPHRAMTWYDFPLDDTTDTLFITPSGATGIVTVQFVSHIPTRLGTNPNGETYGISGSLEGEPDLVAVDATGPDGETVQGYARSTDLGAFSPDHPGQPSNPDEALEWQAERDERYPDGWDIPVYESDGTTRIGTFHIG